MVDIQSVAADHYNVFGCMTDSGSLFDSRRKFSGFGVKLQVSNEDIGLGLYFYAYSRSYYIDSKFTSPTPATPPL